MPRLLLLAIETSNPTSGPAASQVGLFEASEGAPGLRPVSVRTLEPRARHDDALAPAIDAACAEAGVARGDIGRVAVSIGPGGFTALRVAVATGQMLGEALRCEVIAVPTARVAAEGFRLDAGRAEPAPLGALLASKGERAWLSRIDLPGDLPGHGRLGADAGASGLMVDAGDVRRLHEERPFGALLADGHAPESLRAWARDAGVPIHALALSSRACAAASVGLAPVDPAALAPLYPREPEAVRLWRQR